MKRARRRPRDEGCRRRGRRRAAARRHRQRQRRLARRASWPTSACRSCTRPLVGDDVDRIVTALRRALEDADVVVLTGGLGPTVDDLTRDAVAAVAGVAAGAPARARAVAAGAVRRLRLRRCRTPSCARPTCRAARRRSTTRSAPRPGLRLEVGGRLRLRAARPAARAGGGLPRRCSPSSPPAPATSAVTRTLHCAGMGESQVAELVDARRRPCPTASTWPTWPAAASSGSA